MSEQELQQLVEKIVQRVLQRVAADAELSHYLKKEAAPAVASRAQTQRADDPAEAPESPAEMKNAAPLKKLLAENDVLELARSGAKKIVVAKKTILTPAARDAAKSKGIEIEVE